jgi:ubiquinone/menaquinone biosynthesis C-methylase UbiE
MINKLFDYLKKPSLYAESTAKFWDDEHISKGMLEAHLEPDLEAASRKHTFINDSVEWINMAFPCNKYNKLLDLGCGPGLYAERFTKKGYSVTAIDFSKRSIEYAKQKAEEKALSIEYIYQNYLEMEYENEIDLVTLIYCDFGALSHLQREILLKKVYCAMKSGGKFIFDVFTTNNYEGKIESNTWNLNKGRGFWASDTYLCIESHFTYEDDIRLNQYTIVEENGNLNVYRIWDHYYTKGTIIEELKKIGFKTIEIFSDVAGNPYDDKSKTMCIVVEK